MSDNSFILLYTLGCHLCDDAEIIIKNITEDYIKQDIIEDDELMKKYATSIPVLLHTKKAEALYWPFDHMQLVAFIKTCTD